MAGRTSSRMRGVTKRKISASIDGDRLARAVELTGEENVSAVLDAALLTLIERKLEQLWLDAHPASDLPGEVVPDLSDQLWEP